MKLNVKALGLSLGILWGVSLLLLTWLFLIIGQPGNTLSKLSAVYVGYSVSWFGGFVGLIWGFVDGFIGGALIAWLYNKFTDTLVESTGSV